ncbi:hypothetical protein FC093_07335 [Ilyomonas limi]|uniref:Uncharacterized protein n=1 Tax=Ilyomonas limi TaxID=2575867 RepID=A0A4U3L3Y1_9BACT|nr:baseplate J/gp47 family protein [Ilyomonas limi]TKK69881.1 hypothetical protein FC093_07335 [Ilyomonas limi]
MSSKAIDYKILLKRDGQTQQQRYSQWLNPALVPVDGRTKEDFFNYLKQIAKAVNFYDINRLGSTGDFLKDYQNGTWEDFFNLSMDEYNALIANASLPPHLALWDTFMKVYEYPQQVMNTLTQRHLDFYYGEVLALDKNNAVPDKAHVVFELKKNTADTLLPSGTVLLAGKDNTKKDLHYQLTHDIVVNNAKIAQLKSVYVSPVNKNIIRFAPVANSSDGLGATLDANNPKWSAFGNAALPPAQIGFCLASPVLRMKEGDRTVNVSLTLKGLQEKAKSINFTRNLFKISITGEKGWIGPKNTSATITSADNITFIAAFSFLITKDDPSVVNYSAAIHGQSFSTIYPLMQIMINNEKTDFGYDDLKNCELVDATIEVQVNGMKDLQLENDLGSVNNKKPFFPFGPAADVNANFIIDCEEAFSKRLKNFSVNASWKNIPKASLSDYFSGYPNTTNTNDSFTALANFSDGFNWNGTQTIQLFNASDARTDVKWEFNNPNFPSKIIFYPLPYIKTGFITPGQTLAQKVSSDISYLSPNFSVLRVNKTVFSVLPYIQTLLNTYRDSRKGVLNIRLNHTFYFREFPGVYANAVLQSVKPGAAISVPAQPFAPEIQSVAFNYTATTAKTPFNGLTLNDYVDEEIEFFHYGVFGQMREHAYTKSQHPFLNNSIVKLLPSYLNEGEFFIGFNGLAPEDSTCVLFQMAEGSANPDKPKAAIGWSVLCDNYWKELTNADFIFDTTNSFLTSGVIKFLIPKEATVQNTIMPDGLLWLKGSIQADPDAVCSLVDVQAGAAIAIFEDEANDPAHLATPLPANTINKLENSNAAIKSVKQPYASFGGRMQEDDEDYYIRISERLRHKERSISLWDYERLILQHFPSVHKIKCINHATENSFYAPGNVLVILVPDLTNKNAVNPLQPRVDKNTLDEVTIFLQEHTTSWTQLHVSNPYYETVSISVQLKLKTGFEFNYYQGVIDQKLKEFLSPWISDTSSDIHFGGKVTKSMIVKFLEELEAVDFIASLRLHHSLNSRTLFVKDVEVVEASNPAAILVSADHHQITSY